VADFAEDHPEGVYVVATGSHAVCVDSGTVRDNWDSRGEVATYFFAKEKAD